MSKKITLYIVLFLQAFVVQVKAQGLFSCGPVNPPGALTCGQSCIYCNLDGITDKNDQFLPPGANQSLCLGDIPLENPRWYGFIAGSTTIVIDIKYLACLGSDGLQAAVIGNCGAPIVTCMPGPNPGLGGLSSFGIGLYNLVVGQAYQLLIDGLDGDVCSYAISVPVGSTIPPALGSIGTVDGPTQVCPNATVTYTIPPVANAVSYTWSVPLGSKINGTNLPVLTIPASTGTTITVKFGATGGNVCVTASNACSPSVSNCLQVTNTAIPITNLPDKIVCFNDSPYEWEESPNTILSSPGTYILTSSPYSSYLGCDSTVRQKVKLLPLYTKNLPTIFLCEGECFNINGQDYCETGQNQEILTSTTGCDSIINFTTIKIPVKAVIQNPDTLTCARTSVTLTSNGSTVGNSVLYKWFNNLGVVISTTQQATVTSSGLYYFEVTNSQGGKICHDTATVFVVADVAVPVSNAGPPKVLTCAQPQVQLSGSGSTGPTFTYFWTATNGGNIVSGSNTLTPTVNAVGTYRLRVTNTYNGCTSLSSTIVTATNLPPTLGLVGGAITCTNPSLTIQTTTNAQGGTFAWTGPGGFTSALQNPTVNVAGAYSLVITDGISGCTSTGTVTVLADNGAPGATAVGGFITCTEATVSMSGSSQTSGSSFSWSGPNGFTSTIANPTVTTAGTYNLLVTGTNGCTSTASASVQLNNAAPGADLAVSGDINCNNATVNLVTSSTANPANLNHIWTSPNGTQDTTGTLALLVANAPGSYNVLVINTTNGCTSVDTVVVVRYNNVAASISNQLNVACNGANSGSLTAAPGGGNGVYSFLWNNTESTATISNLDGGAYTVTVTDGQGCTASITTTVLEPNVLDANLSATAQTANGTSDGTASANPSGGTPGYTYLWDNSATTTTISGLLPGFYTVTVTDNNGCSDVKTVNVSAYNCSVSGVVEATNINCYGQNNGTASVSIVGGTAPFNYNWSNSQTTEIISNLTPGDYTVTVIDAANCPLVVNFSITEPDTLRVNGVSTESSGPNSNNGTASANPTGGAGAYTYLWDNTETTATISGLAGGSYTVTVTDAKGCSAIETIIVGVGNCSLVTDFLVINPSCSGQASGEATVALTGGTGPFGYLWSSGGTEITEDSLSAGTYFLTITDVNNCQIVDTISLTEPTLLTLSSGTVANTTCITEPGGSATVIPDGGSGSYNINWSNSQTGPTAINLVAGTYTATATDENGCTAVQTVEILAIDLVPPVIEGDSVTVQLGPSGTVTLTLLNLAANVTDNCVVSNVSIAPPTYNCSQLGYHTITLTATDDSGNTSTSTLTVLIVDNASPTLVCPQSIIRCFGNNVVQYNAPTATDNCLGIGGGFALVTGLPSGSTFPQGTTTTTYSYTDGQGNVGSCSFEVTILDQLSITKDTVVNDIENQNIGRVEITVSGSLSPYTYQWFRDGVAISNDTQDLTGVGEGTYTVIVTDANNCSSTSNPLIVKSVVGTNNPSWLQELGIYPNPTTGMVSVVLPDELVGKNQQCYLYDMNGRKVMEQNGNAQKQQNLDLSGFADGMYFILIRMDGDQVTRKIVVNR
jgi:hypothetical protein